MLSDVSMVETSKRRTALVLIFLLKFFSKPLIKLCYYTYFTTGTLVRAVIFSRTVEYLS